MWLFTRGEHRDLNGGNRSFTGEMGSSSPRHWNFKKKKSWEWQDKKPRHGGDTEPKIVVKKSMATKMGSSPWSPVLHKPIHMVETSTISTVSSPKKLTTVSTTGG